mgnify:CR=1 FL=1
MYLYQINWIYCSKLVTCAGNRCPTSTSIVMVLFIGVHWLPLICLTGFIESWCEASNSVMHARFHWNSMRGIDFQLSKKGFSESWCPALISSYALVGFNGGRCPASTSCMVCEVYESKTQSNTRGKRNWERTCPYSWKGGTNYLAGCFELGLFSMSCFREHAKIWALSGFCFASLIWCCRRVLRSYVSEKNCETCVLLYSIGLVN